VSHEWHAGIAGSNYVTLTSLYFQRVFNIWAAVIYTTALFCTKILQFDI